MSHLDWTDDLPPSWQLKPLRSVVDIRVSSVDKKEADRQKAVRLCNYKDVYSNEFIDLTMDFMRATASDREIEQFRLAVGDVLITKDSESWEDIGVPALVTESADDLVCGYHLALLRPKVEVMLGRFLHRSLCARQVQIQLEVAAKGMTRFGLPKLEIGSVVVPVPPLPEQIAISDYLDRETGRLDALVTNKQHLMELLAEKRRALISRTVRQGIAAATPGLDRKLRYLASINDDVLPETTDSDFEIQYIDIGNVDSTGRISKPVTHRFENAPSRARRLVRDGDVILSTVRTYLQAIAQIKEPPDNLVVSTGFAVTRPIPGRFDPSYCKYALRDTAFLAEVERRSVGVSYPAISAWELGTIPVPWHPLPEQKAIARYLDSEVQRLDALLAEIRRSLELLEERRSAVVSWALRRGSCVGRRSAGIST